MKHLDIPKPVLIVLLLAVLLALGAPSLRAQASFVLSKHADFSTDDRVFDRTDTIHMLVTAPQIDGTDLKKNEFRLKPDEGGNDLRGVFANHADGTYTASVMLSSTDPNQDDWAWRARIEDEDGNEFDVRVDLQIGEDDGDDGDGDDGDDDDGDDDDGDDEVEFTGTIDALDAGSITVDGILFVVDDRTVVLDDDNNPIPFSDLAVGMTVEIRGDRNAAGVPVATRIKIEDEDQEDAPAATGRLAAVEEDRLTVDTSTFLIDAATQVFDANDVPMDRAGLEIGQMVEVRAHAAATLPIAAQVKVLGFGDIAAAAVSYENGVPTGFLLEQNYPNPFNPKTTIAFEIGPQVSAESVSLIIYNLLGEVVQTLVQGPLGPGRYQYAWNARNSRGQAVATGVYLYRLRVGKQVQTRTMVVLK